MGILQNLLFSVNDEMAKPSQQTWSWRCFFVHKLVGEPYLKHKPC